MLIGCVMRLLFNVIALQFKHSQKMLICLTGYDKTMLCSRFMLYIRPKKGFKICIDILRPKINESKYIISYSFHFKIWENFRTPTMYFDILELIYLIYFHKIFNHLTNLLEQIKLQQQFLPDEGCSWPYELTRFRAKID